MLVVFLLVDDAHYSNAYNNNMQHVPAHMRYNMESLHSESVFRQLSHVEIYFYTIISRASRYDVGN